MSIRKKTLSVVVPTFNSEKNIGQCLRSIEWADEIIVVDMGSTDKTLAVAGVYNAKIFRRVPQNGNFDQNRKFGMQKASGDWILKLDSDEFLSPMLQIEIQQLLEIDKGEHNGFNLYNRIFMFGKQIKHGFVKPGSHELRLMRNNRWRYDPFRFHQQITVDGTTGYLNGYYEHRNVASVKEFIDKMNRYTNIDAKYYSANLTIMQIFLAPIRSFCKLFFLQLGFLDRLAGLEVCSLYAIYNLTEKIKVWETQNL